MAARSPSQACREESCDWSSDIWSLGCTVLQIATNREPWAECEFEDIIPAFYHIATCTTPPAVPTTLSDLLRAFILLCLELNPHHRPSCSVLLQNPWLGSCGLSSHAGDDAASFCSPRWSRDIAEKRPSAEKRASMEHSVCSAQHDNGNRHVLPVSLHRDAHSQQLHPVSDMIDAPGRRLLAAPSCQMHPVSSTEMLIPGTASRLVYEPSFS